MPDSGTDGFRLLDSGIRPATDDEIFHHAYGTADTARDTPRRNPGRHYPMRSCTAIHCRNRRRTIALLLVLATGLMLLSTRPALAADPEVIDRIAAIVNDDVISLFELKQAARPFVAKVKEMGYPPEQEAEMIHKLHQDLLNQLIDQKLTAQETKKANITVTDAEVDDAIGRIKERGGLTDQALKAALERDGMTLTEYRSRLKEQILRAKLVDREVKAKIVITREDIQKYYDAHPDEYRQGKTYRLRHILLAYSPFSMESERRDVRQKMESIIRQFRNGTDFAELARQYSDAPMAEDGGYLGELALNDISGEIRSALTPLQAGEITPILETDQGLQVIYVESISESTEKEMTEAEKEIQEKLYQEVVDQRFKDWLQDLRETSHVKILDYE